MKKTTLQKTGMGVLAVDVYTGSVGVPVKGAKVQIYSQGENTAKLLEEQRTDESGQTVAMRLPCRPRDDAEAPSKQKPCTEYDLIITAAGFEQTRICNVPIFDGTTAIQPVTLRRQIGGGNREQRIQISPHMLWGSEPRSFVENTPAVLKEDGLPDEPVIPAYVIIHDGAPDEPDAPNYYMQFRDYIKNTVCGQVYPSWSKAAIEAVIVAAVSVTLNRSNGGWYQKQGKSFTLTSIGELDQPFSYGRTIYQEIGEMVDKTFTHFVTRAEERVPLLARCEKQALDNTLSLWDAKRLADQGKSSLEILRFFYGEDIAVVAANKILGVPLLFPGGYITIGAEGNNVWVVQQQLAMIAENYRAIPKTQPNGVYSESTAQAVKAFQKIFHLPQTGVVDSAAWYALASIYTAVKRTLPFMKANDYNV